jgi:hypothetical protein
MVGSLLDRQSGAPAEAIGRAARHTRDMTHTSSHELSVHGEPVEATERVSPMVAR